MSQGEIARSLPFLLITLAMLRFRGPRGSAISQTGERGRKESPMLKVGRGPG